MSLDALAPDQRAVVQLVLQQDRSYDDLAGLLGITTEAVRERAHRGLERLAPADAVDPGERAEVSDYLLGQQSVSGREATRSLLSASPAARAWATTVAGSLSSIARSPLPEIPAAAPEPDPEPFAADPAPTAEEPVVRARPRPRAPEPGTAEAPVTRARPRRRSAAVEADIAAAAPAAATEPTERARDTTPSDRQERKPRTSFAGIALLAGGLTILIIALVVLLANGNDDEPETASSGTTAEETATAEPGATPDYRQIGGLELTAPDGGGAKGQMAVYVAAADGAEEDASVLFQVVGEGLEPTTNGSAYGIWLTGGDAPHFLGFAPKVGEDGRLGTRGPRPEDAANFLTWLSEARNFVISRETTDKAKAPGDIVLTGNIRETSDADPDATPVPTP